MKVKSLLLLSACLLLWLGFHERADSGYLPHQVTQAVAPGAPTNVYAAPGNASAAVTFTPPNSNGGSTITGYTVTSNPPDGTDTNAVGTAGTLATLHTITGLTNGKSYTFTVTAANTIGTGPASNPASNSVTPLATGIVPSLAGTWYLNGISAATALPAWSRGTLTIGPDGKASETGTGSDSSGTITVTGNIWDFPNYGLYTDLDNASPDLLCQIDSSYTFFTCTSTHSDGSLELTIGVKQADSYNPVELTGAYTGYTVYEGQTSSLCMTANEKITPVGAGKNGGYLGNVSGTYTVEGSPKIYTLKGQLEFWPVLTNLYTEYAMPGEIMCNDGFCLGENSQAFMGASKTVTAGTDGPTIATQSDVGLTVFVKPGTSYSLADLKGIWNFTEFDAQPQSGQWIRGTITFDAAGNATMTGLDNSGTPYSASMTFILSQSGVMTCTSGCNGTTVWTLDKGKTLAVGFTGNSSGGNSTAAYLTIVTKQAVPGKPPGAPKITSATAVSSGEVSVKFTAPSGGTKPTAYNATAFLDQNCTNWAGSDNNSGSILLSHTLGGLTNGTQYWFTVTASNANGSTTSAVYGPVTLPNVPGAPTNVSATPGYDQVTVKFTLVPTSKDGGSTIQHYTAIATPPQGQGTAISVQGAGTPIAVTGLTDGTPYMITVTAHNKMGDGAASNPAYGPVTPAAKPGAPTGVGAQVQDVAGGGEVIVSFGAPGNGGSTITKYTVTWSPSASGSKDLNAGTAALSHTITGLKNGQSYTFHVTATNEIGTGPSASSAKTTLFSAPSAPTKATAAAQAVKGGGEVQVSFSAPTNTDGSAVTGYTVTCAGTTVGTAGPTPTPVTVTGLTNGKSYTFHVTATNLIGTGPPATAMVTLFTVPNAPANVKATEETSPGTVKLTFTAPSTGGCPITVYNVTATDITNSANSLTTTGNSASIDVTGLTSKDSYKFEVSATNVIGTGKNSSYSSPVTPN